MSEQRTFVFAVSFIIIFSALVASIPVGFQGEGVTLDIVTPVDPSILTAFADGEDFTESDFILDSYTYALGGRDWVCEHWSGDFALGAKVLIAGIVWLGQLDSVKFISPTGEDHGAYLNIADVEADADNGTVQYSIQHLTSGASAGGFVFYWNTTTYDNSTDAWDNDGLYLLHGIGFTATATSDIGSLLVSLLFLQLPDVPFLVNILLVVPIWASILFVLWFIVKEMIPFV